MRRLMAGVLLAGGLAAIAPAVPANAASFSEIVPVPVTATPASGVTFTLGSGTGIFTDSLAVGNYLAGILRPSTGYALPVATGAGTGIALRLNGSDPAEGYTMNITAGGVVIQASSAAGLFHGVQTLRQLVPANIESATVQPGPWLIPGGQIVDYPRFAYRGAMLDVARHFHPVAAVKRHIDQMALYKINYLHLHLSDDQGWRIVIDSWPSLATYGGSTQVGGGPGGYYTKAQYQDLVAYATSRFITVVPEIDMPGHTNAALASYASLNCNGVAPPLYTGTNVGFSSLCTSLPVTYTFVQNVVSEIAAMTPGPYFHLGGDEADATSPAQYATFMNQVQPIVTGQGKTVMGWHQIGDPAVNHSASRIVQYWGTTTSDTDVTSAVNRGAKVIMSPANKAYLDMKYNAQTPLGLSWAGYIEVQTAYEWNPGTHLSGVAQSAVLGVEAPLWAETIVTTDHIEYMAFPRLPAIAELGWSPWSTHSWTAFRTRLGAQGPRWTIMGIDFYRSPQIPWASPPGPGNRFEAENATISQGVVASNHAGFSGTGFVDYNNVTGSYIQWTVNSAVAGPATVRLRYANGTSANRPLNINGTVHDFTGTGAWTTWATRTLTVNLVAGNNTIRATATTANGGPNVDYLEVDPVVPTTRSEAENAVISQGVVESNHAGFSGTGFVNYDNVSGSYVEFTVNRTASGPATILLRYANGASINRPLNVNGTMLDFAGTGAWSTWASRTLTLNLNAGANLIRATATTANGGPNLDYLEVQ
ncbi:family 20 glycosylhydrolase [Catelliglobosispora koreensis]|uniref:family 20 glycosylhydrolase n=1 Tax=Catelliglobosispora koreensis TaxID=129052 RepID=UPI0012FC9B9C|nr:family 20 glycosylhydrolase [Catelliglobosispora koreensis]